LITGGYPPVNRKKKNLLHIRTMEDQWLAKKV
jgi:hypothetical protein